MGPKTKIKTGGKKFDEQKYERKIRVPGDKLFTHQVKLGRELFCPIRSEYSFGRLELVRKEFVPRGLYFSFILLLVEVFPARFDFRLRPHYLPLGLRGWIFLIKNVGRILNMSRAFPFKFLSIIWARKLK